MLTELAHTFAAEGLHATYKRELTSLIENQHDSTSAYVLWRWGA